MEKYETPFSEQGKYVAERGFGGSPEIALTTRDYARTIVALLTSAERQIGSRVVGSLRDRAHFILQNARSYGVDPTAYAIAHFIWRTSKPEHVTLGNVTTPLIVGVSP
jgi:hypothetical protein